MRSMGKFTINDHLQVRKLWVYHRAFVLGRSSSSTWKAALEKPPCRHENDEVWATKMRRGGKMLKNHRQEILENFHWKASGLTARMVATHGIHRFIMIHMSITKTGGGWPPPLKNIVRQLGWWHSQYDGKVIIQFFSIHHQAVIINHY